MTTTPEIAEVVARLREIADTGAKYGDRRASILATIELIERLDAARVEAERLADARNERWLAAIARSEAAERERDTYMRKWADSESNLAACDSDLRTIQGERDELREQFECAVRGVVTDSEIAASFSMCPNVHILTGGDVAVDGIRRGQRVAIVPVSDD